MQYNSVWSYSMPYFFENVYNGCFFSFSADLLEQREILLVHKSELKPLLKVFESVLTAKYERYAQLFEM